MYKRLTLVLLMCLVGMSAQAQIGRADPSPATTTVSLGGQLVGVVKTIPGASVRVCSYVANPTLSCTPLATTYTDGTGSVTCPTTAQLVLAGTSTCTPFADVNGNFGWWGNPGLYTFCITGQGVTGACYNFAIGLTTATVGGGLLDPRALGMDCLGNTDASTLWTANVTTGTGIFLPVGCILKFGSNVSTPAGSTVQFGQGALFKPTAGVTHTVNGSVVAGNRQKIVDITNGTVVFNGVKDIYVGWYGAPEDGVADDAPATNAALTANPGKNVWMLKTASTPCSSGAGGGCFGTFDGVFNSQVIIPENTSFGGVTAAGFPAGPVQVKCSASLTVACVWMPVNDFNTRIHDLFLYGQRCWSSTDLTTFDVPTAMDGPGPDGLLLSGGFEKVEDVGVYCFERHGIAIIGNNTLGEATAGQPDFFSIKKSVSYGNRGWGVYAVGADANAGLGDFIQTYANMMGGIFDNSQLGSTWNAGSHVDNRSAVNPGATQAITSCTVTSNVLSCTTTAGNTFAQNTWVTTSGFTDATFNTTCKLTSASSANPFTCVYTHANGTASAGTPVAGTASSTQVYAIIMALGGQFAKQGAFASNDASSESVWIDPYCESTSNGVMWGSGSIILGGEAGHGCTANLATGVNPGNMLGAANGGFDVFSTALSLRNFAGTQTTFDIRTDAPSDNVAEKLRFLDHTGTVKGSMGMIPNAGSSLQFNVGSGTTGNLLQGDPAGASWLSAIGATSNLNVQWNSTGPVNFFSATTPTFKITNNGTLQSVVNTFASLASCVSGIDGSIHSISDSTTNIQGATITGGGSNHVLAYCNGTNWVVDAGSSTGLPASPQIGDSLRYNIDGDSKWDATNIGFAVHLVSDGGANLLVGSSVGPSPLSVGGGLTGVAATSTNAAATKFSASAAASVNAVIGDWFGTGGNSGNYSFGSFYRWTFKFAANNTTNVRYWLGLTTYNNGGPGTEGQLINGTTKMATDTPNSSTLGFRFSATTDTNWQAVALVTSGSQTTTDTGVAIDTNPHKFDITYDSTTARYFIDGVLKASIATNVPAASAGGMFPFWCGDNKNTATAIAGTLYWMTLGIK